MYHFEERLCAAVLYRENRVIWIILGFWVIISGKTHSCWFYQAAKQTWIIQIHNRNWKIIATQLLCSFVTHCMTSLSTHLSRLVCIVQSEEAQKRDWQELLTLPGNSQWHTATLFIQRHVSCVEHHSDRTVWAWSYCRSLAPLRPSRPVHGADWLTTQQAAFYL